MTIKVIKNNREHQQALKAIERLWNAKPRTSQGDKLELLSALVEAYEQSKYKILPPDPIEAIKIQDGARRAELC